MRSASQAPAEPESTRCITHFRFNVRPRRATADLDFQIQSREPTEGSWPELERAIAEAASAVGIAVQYAEDVDRWSSVAIPRERRRTRAWRRFGLLEVELLEPLCWAVYKLARYLDSDVEDLVAVLGNERIDPLELAEICGASLASSPRSSSLWLFRRQVERFFREEGPRVWTKDFASEVAVERFHRLAGIGEDGREAATRRGRK